MNFWHELHTNICKTLQAKISAIKTCTAYPVLQKAVKAPAVFVELAQLEPGHDPGTEELALVAHFEARIVVDSLIKDAHVIVRSLASEVARVVNMNTFDLPISPARFVSAAPDAFKPELDAYLVWAVTWTHELHQGQSIWTTPDITPHTITIGEQRHAS